MVARPQRLDPALVDAPFRGSAVVAAMTPQIAALAEELDGHLPRMAFHMYGQYVEDDPLWDIDAYYQRVAEAVLNALSERGFVLLEVGPGAPAVNLS